MLSISVMNKVTPLNRIQQDYQMKNHQNFWRPVSIADGRKCLAPHSILKVKFILPAQSWNPAPPTTAADQRLY